MKKVSFISFFSIVGLALSLGFSNDVGAEEEISKASNESEISIEELNLTDDELTEIIEILNFEGADDFITIDGSGGFVILLSRTTVENVYGLTSSAASEVIEGVMPGTFTPAVVTTVAEWIVDYLVEEYLIEPLQIEVGPDEDAVVNFNVQEEWTGSSVSIIKE
ncbi:hypothetical protein [Geomicrobium sp. JCM 19055]|uniref:hypothetical protein n=1 Tax=Geomicrobium sp. JCM 19055 TaxID=1460649 RepID=UPI00045ED7C0|nr:hypothetical protein [Geomicrobium sp. JCM 19055]GAJ97878.1 hypothetical protein JCM19055_766 [Geomicrobium sp. JCM 19055]